VVYQRSQTTWFATLLAVLLAIVVGGCDGKASCEKPYSCPESEHINCRLPLSEGMQDLCSGECHEWILENCPEVEFAW
jgi:hypothetical protein